MDIRLTSLFFIWQFETKTMTKQGSTAHGFLKIADSRLECIPFTSTGITLFVSHQPYRSLSQQLSCTQLQAYSPFHFL